MLKGVKKTDDNFLKEDIMKNFKKIVSVVMLVVLFTTNITAYASVTSSEELSNTDMRQFAEVTSSEFPDAFILSQYYDRDELGIHINNETISINSDKKRIGLGEKETVIIKDLSLAQALEVERQPFFRQIYSEQESTF